MKKIEFMPSSSFCENNLPRPVPSSKLIPEWYSKMSLFSDKNDKTYKLRDEGSTNTTLKACSPFLDALSFGYMWTLPFDLQIKKNYNNSTFFFQWRIDQPFITQHHVSEHYGLPSAFDGSDLVFKFKFDFSIKTPKGYSTFFTHPLNRHDLNFRTFSGIVDTDKYYLPIQLPFQLLNNKDDSFIIERGTPICQIIPFKRDFWKSSFSIFNEIELDKKIFNFKSIIKKSYKTQYWHIKKFV